MGSKIQGIYLIEIGSYKYVGQSVNCKRRIKNHFRDLKLKRHKNHKMQAVYDEYKEFNSTILEEIAEQKDLAEKELHYINEYNTYSGEFGLNRTLQTSVNTALEFEDIKDRIEYERLWQQKQNKKYYEKNKEKIIQRRKIYLYKNKEKISQYNKQYYAKNKEQSKIRSRQHYIENSELIKQQSRLYRENNKEKIKIYRKSDKRKKYNEEYFKKYQKANKDKINGYSKKYQTKNADKVSLYRKNRNLVKNMNKTKQRLIDNGCDILKWDDNLYMMLCFKDKLQYQKQFKQ